jgi:hypothetical protein
MPQASVRKAGCQMLKNMLNDLSMDQYKEARGLEKEFQTALEKTHTDSKAVVRETIKAVQ